MLCMLYLDCDRLKNAGSCISTKKKKPNAVNFLDVFGRVCPPKGVHLSSEWVSRLIESSLTNQ